MLQLKLKLHCCLIKHELGQIHLTSHDVFGSFGNAILKCCFLLEVVPLFYTSDGDFICFLALSPTQRNGLNHDT
jgi:hypothetical protein